MAGRDPHVAPTVLKPAVGLTVVTFLDLYFTNYVEAEGLTDPVTVSSRLKGIKRVLGDLPVGVLEKPADILRFKAMHRKGREIATVNRALATLRAAINWGRSQDPPYLTTTPFHRFGVSIKVKEETKRDRRVGLQEEQALLAASSEMNGAEHRYVGAPMHDRLIGALETCSRQGEMLRIQNPARGLGEASDRHSRQAREGPGEPSHPVRSRGTPGADSQSAQVTRSECVRVRLAGCGVRGELQDGLGSLLWWRTATTRNARNTVRESIEKNFGRSTCTGTTSVTRAPVGF